MESTERLVEQIKELVAPLSPEQRLRVIQAISVMPEASSPSVALERSMEEIMADQEWWFNLPLHVRQKYRGKHVAVYQNTVIDQDQDVRTLHRRVREKHGSIPILVIDADWQEMPVYQFPGFQLER
jgi:hypothetical protein